MPRPPLIRDTAPALTLARVGDFACALTRAAKAG
jgi:hypothetical protein